MKRLSILLILSHLVGCEGVNGDSEDVAGGTTDRPERPVELKNEDLFECDGQLAATPGRIRRMDRMEYSKNVAASRRHIPATVHALHFII